MSMENELNAKEEAMKSINKEMDLEEIADILGTTIKQDRENKVIALLIMVGTYLGDEQSNIMFRSESSTGKTYIALELAQYFPQEDVKRIGYASPTAFFHEFGPYDKDRHARMVDMEKKIFIFKDQPSMSLMARLRSLLSHDEKELQVKFTDKSQKSGFRAKNVIIIGFPTVIMCTATKKINLQESTRFFQLSPDIYVEKIEEAIHLTARRNGQSRKFEAGIRENVDRLRLKNRILDIKEASIKDVIISNSEEIAESFIRERKLNPRHMRDFQRLLRLIKYWALLNFHNRKREGDMIYSNQIDVEVAYILYSKICEANEMGISPEIYEIYHRVIEKNVNDGFNKRDIFTFYLKEYQRPLSTKRLNEEIIPTLEAAGLIYWDESAGSKPKIYRLSKNLEEREQGEKIDIHQAKLGKPLSIEDKEEVNKKVILKTLFIPQSSDQIQKLLNDKIPPRELSRLLDVLSVEGKITMNNYKYKLNEVDK
mgnify:CR=1 FL=1